MKLAFTAKGTTWDSNMDARFGRTEFLLIYDDISKELSSFDNRESANNAHGAGPKTAQYLFELKADALITGNGPGGNAAAVMEKTGIKIHIGAGAMTVKEAYDAFQKGELKKV